MSGGRFLELTLLTFSLTRSASPCRYGSAAGLEAFKEEEEKKGRG